ncbi:MAG TPA: sulfatase-like hydrolase/transferase [Bryobacteraceae bacterium]|nr:sulfatase-like hydrolase/transferase [Bryobacteraceae bacterium]
MTLPRREFLLGSLPLAHALAQKKNAGAAPNILVIIAENLGSWMLGCYGNKLIRTPNIDLLARGGARFANAFVCTPSSSPSRATLLTGRLPAQHGIQDFLTPEPVENPPQGQAAPPPSFQNEVLISDVLAGAGYQCGHVGKWRLGGDSSPQHHYSFWATEPDSVEAKTNEFLDQQSSQKPFFLTVGYFNTHEGVAPKYFDLYAKADFEEMGRDPLSPHALRDKEMMRDPVGSLRKFAAGLTALDDRLPSLLAKLQQRGLRDNTLVVFCAANGYLLGRHGLWSDGLASNPINMYEEVMEVPMIWNWPGRIPVESVRNELVSHYDFLPAICEVAAVPAPEGRALFGRSFARLAFGRPLPRKQPWRNLVFGQYRNTRMVRDSRYKLVQRNKGDGPNELFDLTLDPRERLNRFDNPANISVRDQLTRELTSLDKVI